MGTVPIGVRHRSNLLVLSVISANISIVEEMSQVVVVSYYKYLSVISYHLIRIYVDGDAQERQLGSWRKAGDNWILEHHIQKKCKISLLGSDLSQWPAGGQMSLGRQREVQFSLINFRNYVQQLENILKKCSKAFICFIFLTNILINVLSTYASCPDYCYERSSHNCKAFLSDRAELTDHRVVSSVLPVTSELSQVHIFHSQLTIFSFF